MLSKNDRITLTITDITENGEGIGRYEGYPLFVKDAMIGDVAQVTVTKVGKTYGFGRLSELLTPSPDRVLSSCPLAAPCGGCQLQALSYPAQLRFKENKVRQHLQRLGGFEEAGLTAAVEAILGCDVPFYYRNKAQIPFGKDKDGQIVAGYYAERSHRIVPMAGCALNEPGFDEILGILLDFARTFHIEPYEEETGRGLLRHALIRCGHERGTAAASGEAEGAGSVKKRPGPACWMVCLIINGRRLPHADELVRRLRGIPGMADISLNVNRARTNVILGQEIIPLWGPGYLTASLSDLRFRLSPLAFFQVNTRQTERLYAKALEYAALSGRETVWDLYCGTGTISLFLARHAAQVYGVEIIPQAIENAKENALLNGIGNVSFFVGKSEEIFPAWLSSHPEETADAVILDPPRKGCDAALLKALLRAAPERIVYVSCNSATLARDLRVLCEEGSYRLDKYCPVDLFPQTVSCETVVLLSQQRYRHETVRVEVDMEELEPTSAEAKATYKEIQEYVLEQHGMKVSSLYISQITRKCGLEVGEHYNQSKNENARVPTCPPDKEEAIVDALRHFKMIS